MPTAAQLRSTAPSAHGAPHAELFCPSKRRGGHRAWLCMETSLLQKTGGAAQGRIPRRPTHRFQVLLRASP